LFQRRLRVEHWQNAMQQGAAAARSILGRRDPYDPVPWFWSDQYGMNLQYAGFHQRSDRLVVRGSVADRTFLAFYMNGGRVESIVSINRGKELRRALPLIGSRRVVEAERLEDEDVDLRSAVQGSV
jgi:3-phenylpropionate/trans-cinnamate dioxygenase ferredoxin reductase subunit